MFIGNKRFAKTFLFKIYKRLSLSTVFSNTNSKMFYAGNDFTLTETFAAWMLFLRTFLWSF